MIIKSRNTGMEQIITHEQLAMMKRRKMMKNFIIIDNSELIGELRREKKIQPVEIKQFMQLNEKDEVAETAQEENNKQ